MFWKWRKKPQAEPQPMPQQTDKPVVVWDSGNSFYVLEIFADGRTSYRQDQAMGFGPLNLGPPVEGRLSPTEQRELRATLEKHAKAIAALNPPMRNLIPDETTKKVVISWDGIELEKAMLANDWYKFPASNEVAEALHGIAALKGQKNRQ
jgi:hypothetical protein